VQLRERQIKKIEGKIEFEVAKQEELQRQINQLNEDKKDLASSKEAVKTTYDILE